MKQIALICLLLPAAALAQDFGRGEVYGGYSFLSVDTNGTGSRQNFNGWEGSGTVNITSLIGLEASLAGTYKNLGTIQGLDVNAHDYLFGAGPKLMFRPLFVHALLGVDHFSASTSGPQSTTVGASQNAFAAVLGGGIEWKISRHWAIRPSLDYVLTRHESTSQNDVRFGVGLAYGFGR